MTTRVAVVTGAARGIGRATALRLGREGLRVVASGREKSAVQGVCDAIAGSGSEAIPYVGDLQEASTPAKLIDAAVTEWGRVDVLVNAAGIARLVPLLEADLATWNEFLNLHLTATFLTTQAAAKAMIAGGNSGVVVNLSSISASMAMYGTGPYATAKGGVSTLTRVFALELAAHGITVNAVAPGPVATEQLRKVYDERMYRDRSAAIPLNRLAEPEEVADVIAFLASPQARYITGQVLTLDGGASAAGCYSYETYKRQRSS